nr:hypothetical protein [bacterium]
MAMRTPLLVILQYICYILPFFGINSKPDTRLPVIFAKFCCAAAARLLQGAAALYGIQAAKAGALAPPGNALFRAGHAPAVFFKSPVGLANLLLFGGVQHKMHLD